MADDVRPDQGGAQTPQTGGVRRARISRRRLLQTAGVAGGVAVVGGVTGTVASVGRSGAGVLAATSEQAPGYRLPDGFSGTTADLRHVVILMQENRSFDHYFGQLPGVRGHNDKQALRFQNGTTVFEQPNGAGVVTPFHSASQGAGSLNHAFYGANGGRWNTWIADKGTSCMRYFMPADLPVNYALASQYTVCDMNFCSIHGPTSPNRLYLMSGTSGGETGNVNEVNYGRTWSTICENLQDAGISWRVYSDNTVQNGGWVGDYGDNTTKYFVPFDPSTATAEALAPGTGLVWRGNAFHYASTGVPNNDSETNLDGVLRDFIAACQPGAEFPLPDVSWIVAPPAWSEHPSYDPVHGARFVKRIIETLQGDEDLWNHTLLIITYDENDGIFDHVLPPRPEPGTTAEFSGTTAYGLGPRVPMVLVSPWTRGGWVASEVFDHTSTIKFLETWAAYRGKTVHNPNITAWRRSIVGDLTSALDFAHPVVGPLALPDPTSGTAPAIPDGRMQPRPLSFHPHGTFSEDRAAGTVTANLSLAGGPEGKAVSLAVFPDRYLPFLNTPYTVTAAHPRQHVWDVSRTDGRYAFSIYGPDGFVRSHAGTVVPAGRRNVALPRVEVDLVAGAKPKVLITMYNDGAAQVRFTLTAHDYLGGTQTYYVSEGRPRTVEWPTHNGYYDVIITADTGTGWTHRYAGRVAAA